MNEEIYFNIISDYFVRIENKLPISDLFTNDANIYSHKFQKLTLDEYQNKLENQNTISIQTNILKITYVDDVVIIYLEFSFDNSIKRKYVDVFQFNDHKIANLYLNRLATK